MDADPDDPDLGFHLVNESGITIEAVHVSPDWKRDWGVDRILDGPIESGETIFISIDQEDGYCYFDVLVTDQDDHSETFWFINACEHETIIYP